MRRPLRHLSVLLALAACGGGPAPVFKCGETTLEFDADCAEVQSRIVVANALLGLFETDPALIPPPPSLVVDHDCDPHSCVGSEMKEMLHRMLHTIDLEHYRYSTFEHVQWEERGYNEALKNFDHWVTNEQTRHPIRKTPAP